ncbi:MAG: hypothetical protein LBR06_08295 [Bacteroidales bacterium]|jgi:hypothetical protein|nr:hypothetical protein [Bacteroidales bacterium]
MKSNKNSKKNFKYSDNEDDDFEPLLMRHSKKDRGFKRRHSDYGATDSNGRKSQRHHGVNFGDYDDDEW